MPTDDLQSVIGVQMFKIPTFILFPSLLVSHQMRGPKACRLLSL